MKILPCNLIKDLLPNFIENKVGNETESVIRNHIDTCDECMAEYNNMKTFISFDNIKVKKIDFLKPMYIKLKNALLICIFLTFIMFLISMYLTETNIENTISSLMFFIFLLILVILRTLVPLFISVLTAFLYRKTNKKWLIIIYIVSASIFIFSIITEINTIMTYGF